jgi:hypothetical protein
MNIHCFDKVMVLMLESNGGGGCDTCAVKSDMKRNPKPWLWKVTFLVLGHGNVFFAFNFLQSSGVVPTGTPSLILSVRSFSKLLIRTVRRSSIP